eukprot:6209702-Pleurochrysis_carterae.AAC.1
MVLPNLTSGLPMSIDHRRRVGSNLRGTCTIKGRQGARPMKVKVFTDLHAWASGCVRSRVRGSARLCLSASVCA